MSEKFTSVYDTKIQLREAFFAVVDVKFPCGVVCMVVTLPKILYLLPEDQIPELAGTAEQKSRQGTWKAYIAA